jgi:translation elongation factor EF-1beta
MTELHRNRNKLYTEEYSNMSNARLKATVPKDFEIRQTNEFCVYCAIKEPAFKPVASAAVAAAPKGETKTSDKKAKTAPAAEEEDDDDLDDMFGDSDEEEDAERQKRIDAIAAAHNAKKEAKRIAKGKSIQRDINSYVFDVKPYDVETDLEQMAQDFKKVTHNGIKSWGLEHKLIPVAYGIKKLRIQVICYGDDGDGTTKGDSFGEDELHDIMNELHEDDIQSIDTHSFTKM